MIQIIDYNMGNVGSIKNMFHHIGVDDVEISYKIEDIKLAEKYILPGVGAFDAGMKQLNSLGILEELKYQVLNNNKPLLGICLGMQLLGRKSEEGNPISGIDLIPFDVVAFSNDIGLKIPHMGWDYVNIKYSNDRMVDGLTEEIQRYYFVHGYHAVCESTENVLMECDYGYKFAAAVRKDNIYGVQFHPEKSHKYGMKLLSNFAKL